MHAPTHINLSMVASKKKHNLKSQSTGKAKQSRIIMAFKIGTEVTRTKQRRSREQRQEIKKQKRYAMKLMATAGHDTSKYNDTEPDQAKSSVGMDGEEPRNEYQV